MKIALITPHYHDQTRGNAVTVTRIEHHLREEGADVRVYSLDSMLPGEILAGLRHYAPDLVHAFHAMHGGNIALQAAELFAIPYMVTLTGTDIYGQPGSGSGLSLGVLARAALVSVFHESISGRLIDSFPQLKDKIFVVPQGVFTPPFAGRPASAGSEFIFLLPAGIRSVKNPVFALAPLAVLRENHPHLRLLLAGPILEPACGAALAAAIGQYPFASWLGEVPRSEMTPLYQKSAVVLNTSLSEGGMANSLLEAMACGVAVLAADIEGNRSLVTDGVNGLLYADEADFISKAAALLQNDTLRQRLAEAGRGYVVANCSPCEEAKKYLQLYSFLL